MTTIDALNKELDETQKRGFGTAHGDAEEGVGAIAVAVFLDGSVLGTLSVAAPINRLPSERIVELLPLLQKAATRLAMAWSGKSK